MVLPELLQVHWQEFGSDLATALREVWRQVEEEGEGERKAGRGRGGRGMGRRKAGREEEQLWQQQQEAWEKLKNEVEEVLSGGKEGRKGSRKALWKRVEFVPDDHTCCQLRF